MTNKIKPYLKSIKAIWHDVTQVNIDDYNLSFFDAGGNSISLVYVKKQLEEKYDIDIKLIDLYKYKTICELAELVHNKLLINKYKSLLNTYIPNEKNNIGYNTSVFFKTIEKSNVEFDLKSLREASISFDEDIILTYPNNISKNSYEDIKIGPYKCKILRHKESMNVPNIIMFYGGGFCINMMTAHLAFMAQVYHLTKCNVILPEYDLAPEKKANDILLNAKEFLENIISNRSKYNLSDDFIISGWSSGASLAATTTLNLQENMLLYKHIKSLVLFSSWIDLTMEVNKYSPYQNQQAKDKFAADHSVLSEMAKMYVPNNEPLNKYDITKRETIGLAKLPESYIIVGEFDVLLSDSIYLADSFKKSGVKTSLCILKGQTHNYPVFKAIQDGMPAERLFAKIINDEYQSHEEYRILE